jgi:hypothetical protein
MTALLYGHDVFKDRLLSTLRLRYQTLQELQVIPLNHPHRRDLVRRRRIARIEFRRTQELLNRLYAPDALPREAQLGRKDPLLSNLNGPRVYTE